MAGRPLFILLDRSSDLGFCELLLLHFYDI
jgi:hypothetical protein